MASWTQVNSRAKLVHRNIEAFQWRLRALSCVKRVPKPSLLSLQSRRRSHTRLLRLWRRLKANRQLMWVSAIKLPRFNLNLYLLGHYVKLNLVTMEKRRWHVQSNAAVGRHLSSVAQCPGKRARFPGNERRVTHEEGGRRWINREKRDKRIEWCLSGICEKKERLWRGTKRKDVAVCVDRTHDLQISIPEVWLQSDALPTELNPLANKVDEDMVA